MLKISFENKYFLFSKTQFIYIKDKNKTIDELEKPL